MHCDMLKIKMASLLLKNSIEKNIACISYIFRYIRFVIYIHPFLRVKFLFYNTLFKNPPFGLFHLTVNPLNAAHRLLLIA